MMNAPRVRAVLATSLDGYISRLDGSVDWLHDFFTPEIDFGSFMAGFGATIMGRRTFDEALQRGHGPSGGGRGIVLTHRPLPKKAKGVEAWSGDLRARVAKLAAELTPTGKDIWLMGGGAAIAAFQAEDLIDRYEISVMPVLLGDGVPLFPRRSAALAKLRCVGTKSYKNGIVELRYERGK